MASNALKIAKRFGVERPPNDAANDIFSSLIEECHIKHGIKAAVLIGERDAPIMDLVNKPDEAEEVRSALRGCCRRLNEKRISFVFATGVAKHVQGG